MTKANLVVVSECRSVDSAGFRQNSNISSVAIRTRTLKRLVPVVTVRAAIHLHNSAVTVAQVRPLCHKYFAKKKAARHGVLSGGDARIPGVTPLGWPGTSGEMGGFAATCKCECHSRVLAPAREKTPERGADCIARSRISHRTATAEQG